MTHIGMGPPEIDGVMELMRPGDILTHCFTGNTMRIVEESGNLRETVKRAWDAGLVLDIGHGAGSFSFKTAEALMSAGLPAGRNLLRHPPDERQRPDVRTCPPA